MREFRIIFNTLAKYCLSNLILTVIIIYTMYDIRLPRIKYEKN